MKTLQIKNLHARVVDSDIEILKGVNLDINLGETHVLMGPNGSGKSTLSHIIFGHPSYEVTEGEIILDGQNILELETDERAKLGLFLAFQYPSEIPGLKVGQFLMRIAEIYAEQKNEKFKRANILKDIMKNLEILGMDKSFINRYLNDGFSGGEKKRMEILQMMSINPKFAFLDEIDSGLDIDALKYVSKGIKALKNDDFSVFMITHYQRILQHLSVDRVSLMYKGKIVESGGKELIEKLESKGYEWLNEGDE